MTEAAANGNRREHDRGVASSRDGVANRLRNSGIGVGRQMWAVLLDRAHRNQTDTSVQSEMRDLGRRELAPPHSEGLCWPSLAAAVHTTMTRGIAALRYAGSENAPKSFRAFVPRCAGGAAGVPLGPDLYERNPRHRFPSGICRADRSGRVAGPRHRLSLSPGLRSKRGLEVTDQERAALRFSCHGGMGCTVATTGPARDPARRDR